VLALDNHPLYRYTMIATLGEDAHRLSARSEALRRRADETVSMGRRLRQQSATIVEHIGEIKRTRRHPPVARRVVY
jgi:hypothetical protein